MSPTIAVLALQGAFIEHEQRLQSLGCTTIELRQAADALEQMCPAHLWPMPTYGELLYGV